MIVSRSLCRLLCLLLVPLCLAGLLPGVASAQSPRLDNVTLQLRWFHQFQFAGYYAAKAKGYYEEAGLNVRIVERDLRLNPVDEVLAGKADFGVTNSEILSHRLKGKPVVVLASIFQHSPLVLIVKDGSRVVTPHDLEGKRVLLSTKAPDVELLGMLLSERVPLSKVEIIDRFSTEGDYYDPSIDAVAAYMTNEPYYLQKLGVPFSVMYPATYGIDFYGDCLFTSQEQIERHPERVRRFREASLKGWTYAMSHPQEIIRLILSEYPTKKSYDHLVYEARQVRELMRPELVTVGHINPGRWKHMAEVFQEVGVAEGRASLDGFLYDPKQPVDGNMVYIHYWLGISAGAFALFALLMWLFNRKLQKEVALRTEDLSLKAAQLEKVNRQLTELDNVKSALLSSVSHELRTPLTAVLGFVKLIDKEFRKTFAPLVADSPELEKKHQRITKNLQVVSVEGERLTRLIGDVLDLSRIESGKEVWRDDTIDLGELARNAVAVVQEQFARKPDVRLVVDVPDTIPDLCADPDRLVQVLINLLNNAGKFTDKGEVRLALSISPAKELVITVSDTGVGVPASEVDDIFNMFHQVHRGDTLSTENRGAGLGLAICRGIVEHYGGTISLASQVGKGSTFTVVLPVSSEYGKTNCRWAEDDS